MRGFTNLKLLAGLIVLFSLSAQAQFSTSPYNNQTDPNAQIETRFNQLQYILVVSTLRSEVKVCIDRLYIEEEFETLDAAYASVDRPFGGDAWSGLTRFCYEADVEGLMYLRDEITKVAGLVLSDCQFAPLEDWIEPNPTNPNSRLGTTPFSP